MHKKNFHKLCYGLSILLVIVFVISLIRDYVAYNTTLNSAPFSLWVTVNCVYFLLPAGILFTVGLILKKKAYKKSQD